MYFWIFIAHMVTPLGEAGLKQIDNEEPLLTATKSAMPVAGTYIFPRMNSANDMEAQTKKIATGPSGFLIYFPAREFNFGQSLAIEFATELVAVTLGMWLLSFTRLSSFAGRLGFFVILGVCVAAANNVSFWNWYGLSGTYVAAQIFTGVVGYACAGMVAGAMKIGGEAR